MHRLIAILLLAAACGGKTAPEPAPAAPAEPVAPAEVAEPAPEVAEPEPEAEPAAPNANFKVALTFADGRTVSGKVVRQERGSDWYAEEGWTDEPSDLLVTLEGNGTEVQKPWTEIASVDIRYGAKSDVDCMYESEYTPWMYTCTLRTTSTVKTTDGKTWAAVSRHKWKFELEDGTVQEFYVHKLPVRRQDETEVSLDTVNPENHDLYAALQAEVAQQARESVTRIVITP